MMNVKYVIRADKGEDDRHAVEVCVCGNEFVSGVCESKSIAAMRVKKEMEDLVDGVNSAIVLLGKLEETTNENNT